MRRKCAFSAVLITGLLLVLSSCAFYIDPGTIEMPAGLVGEWRSDDGKHDYLFITPHGIEGRIGSDSSNPLATTVSIDTYFDLSKNGYVSYQREMSSGYELTIGYYGSPGTRSYSFVYNADGTISFTYIDHNGYRIIYDIHDTFYKVGS